jgi:hypothetical protein
MMWAALVALVFLHPWHVLANTCPAGKYFVPGEDNTECEMSACAYRPAFGASPRFPDSHCCGEMYSESACAIGYNLEFRKKGSVYQGEVWDGVGFRDDAGSGFCAPPYEKLLHMGECGALRPRS